MKGIKYNKSLIFIYFSKMIAKNEWSNGYPLNCTIWTQTFLAYSVYLF